MVSLWIHKYNMNFKLWESSLVDLYQSAVDAFPQTTLRQHATQPIKITNLRWIPYKGMKTLFIRGLAQNEEREYSPIVLFKRVRYRDELDEGVVAIIASNGEIYNFDKLSLENTDVLVRCNCPDFKWRFNFYDHLDKSLYGRKRGPYTRLTEHRPPANPKKMPGMCKHVLKTVEVLKEAGIFDDT